jgi:hypothetical protein
MVYPPIGSGDQIGRVDFTTCGPGPRCLHLLLLDLECCLKLGVQFLPERPQAVGTRSQLFLNGFSGAPIRVELFECLLISMWQIALMSPGSQL